MVNKVKCAGECRLMYEQTTDNFHFDLSNRRFRTKCKGCTRKIQMELKRRSRANKTVKPVADFWDINDTAVYCL
jgi:hypothetical protein